MSLDEKKAGRFLMPSLQWTIISEFTPSLTAYWVAFGPHGIRTPVSKPGDNFRIFLGTAGVIAASVAAFFVIRQYGMLHLWSRRRFKLADTFTCSATPSKDDDQRVARSFKRARKTAEIKPDNWWVP